jgi:hypothetical protein
MFTSQLAIDLVLVALGTALILLVLWGVRDGVRRLSRREGVTPPKRPAISPALALAGALVALLGVHVMRTGLPSAEASPGPEEVGTAAALGRGRATDAVAVGPVSARIGTVMGRSTLDLREAIIGPGEEAVVTVFVAMGRVTLRVPDGWELDATALPAISTVNDTREPRPGAGEDAHTEPAPRLVLRGLVMLGTVEVTS